jgi:hypothetical protein
MAKGTKKVNNKKGGLRPFVPGDPPIIVGGGGSTYIWMLKDIKPQFIDPSDAPDAPPHASRYFCLVCDVDVQTIEADDGIPGAGNHKVKPDGGPGGKVDPKKHQTKFS